jgi:GT2 family glycosyltransferase
MGSPQKQEILTEPNSGVRGNVGISSLDDVALALERPRVSGKFIFVRDKKFWVRGVTYGPFAADERGSNYPSPKVIEKDFSAITSAGLNTLRLYTVPPVWLLDLAAAQGLRVMLGLPVEQHVAFLDDKSRVEDIITRVQKLVRQCAGHPAILCYVVGNEIPTSVVRWHGKRRIENFIGRLYRVVKAEDPGALVTYVNYPTTEYLDLPFIDFVAFNVYLESREQLSSYLARLQNLAGERPLLLTEFGLDSRRNGETAQAETLQWQIATSFEKGCAGAVVFAWTDEWNREGYEVTEWDFGLTARDRKPKPALATVARAFDEVPFPRESPWPRISVVVCSYNGARTIEETLRALTKQNYPDYEVIVVDDGSTDATADIARKYNVALVQSENKGLSNARNLGMAQASGEIIAYIDDDAYPDVDWLQFLAASFAGSDHVGIGGPNIAPPGDGLIADAVAHAPGGPVHVLLSDEVAEHIPGCNMAYRLDRLKAIGGFDPRFRVAGDDVDVCWRLQERGWTLGFSPAAVVWHHRRRSVGTYWKQQKGYAKAEALLADKWPRKYNGAGHLNWNGRLYGKGIADFFLTRPRVYYGTWGSALFQSVYQPAHGLLYSLPLMPEWYALLAMLAGLILLGLAWTPLLLITPIFTLAVGASLIQAVLVAAKQPLGSWSPQQRPVLRAVIVWLHLIQPLARLLGRMRYGLGPWRWAGLLSGPLSLMTSEAIWCEKWQSLETRVAEIEKLLLRKQAIVIRGGDFDRWDLEIRSGLWGFVRVLVMQEEHGAGKQLFRARVWPQIPAAAIVLFLGLAFLTTLAAYNRAWLAAVILGLGALGIVLIGRSECAKAVKIWNEALDEYAPAGEAEQTLRLRTVP